MNKLIALLLAGLFSAVSISALAEDAAAVTDAATPAADAAQHGLARGLDIAAMVDDSRR